jgi:acetyltransferase-like isoleucine patch superfamily enzyme
LISIYSTAEVSSKAKIGENSKIWHHAQIRENAIIGENCIIGKGVYIDKNVKIGNNCKIQNYSCIYHGVILEDGVFIGPGVKILNDKFPRAISPDGKLKNDSGWTEGKILIKKGASIGAGVIILPDVTVGEFALVGAGSVVTKNIPPYSLAYGNPAKIVGEVDRSGKVINK